MSLVEAGRITGVLCATTVTTLYYLQSKSLGGLEAKKRIRLFLIIFEVAPVNDAILLAALNMDTPDYEDAVICEAALAAKCDAIVTRDPRGFSQSSIRVASPGEMLDMIQHSMEG